MMHAMSSNSCAESILRWAPLVKEDTLNILIIHDLEKEKIMLADALANIEAGMKSEIHVAKTLPLPGRKYQNDTNYNYLIFMLDFARRHSFTVFEEAVKLVDINFFLDRSCFVTVNILKKENACCRSDIIREIQNTYKTPVFHVNFSSEERINHTASVIMQHIKDAFEI